MDFKSAFEILAERCSTSADASSLTSTNCCSEHCKRTTSEFFKREQTSKTINAGVLQDLTSLEIVNLLSALQGERVQIYKDFDSVLEILLADGAIASYPTLCAEITSLFSVLSQKVISIKEVLMERNLHDLATLIARLQELEKEKLLLTAAMHLDTIRDSVPAYSSLFGPAIPNQKDSMKSKISSLELAINDILEKIQIAKCDLIDN